MKKNALFFILLACFFWSNAQKQRPNLNIPLTHYQNPIFSGDFPVIIIPDLQYGIQRI